MRSLLLSCLTAVTALTVGCGGPPGSLPPGNLTSTSTSSNPADGGSVTTAPVDAGTTPTGPSQPTTITVNGTVIDASGHPSGNLAVVLGTQTPVNTDAQGRFSFSNVTPPYDLTLVDSVSKSAVQYQGLTRADPTLLHINHEDAAARTATVSGRITGGTYPQTSSDSTLVGFVSPEGHGLVASGADGSYVLDASHLSWAGTNASSGRLHALQIHLSSAGLPTGYGGYAAKDVTVSAGGTFSSQDLGLVPVSNGTLTGGASAAGGYQLTGRLLFLNFDGRPAGRLVDLSTSAGFNYLTPNVTGVSFSLEADAERPGVGSVMGYQFGMSGVSNSVTLALPAAPEAVLPADGATAVDTQMAFSWSPFANGVHIVEFEPDAAGAPSFYVVTAAAHARIPDLRALGFALPSHATYWWSVLGFAPFVSVDDSATPRLNAVLAGTATGQAFEGASDWRSFTTAY